MLSKAKHLKFEVCLLMDTFSQLEILHFVQDDSMMLHRLFERFNKFVNLLLANAQRW